MSESIGKQLQAARIAQGLEIEDVAHKTRIHHDVLRQLEADAYGQLPNTMFVKSFIKLYGDHVGVDTSSAVANLKTVTPVSGQQFLLGGINPSVRNLYGHLSLRLPVRPILASAAVLIAVAIGGSYLVSHLYGGNSPTAGNTEPTPATAIEETNSPETPATDTNLVSAPDTSPIPKTVPLAPIDTVIPKKEAIDHNLIPKGTPVVNEAETVPEGEVKIDDSEQSDETAASESSVTDEPYEVSGFATREEEE